MIVVAIIGILAAIAVPNFTGMQYRAKRAEVPWNVDGIKTAELGYDAAFDGFIGSGGVNPPRSISGASGKVAESWATGTGFDTLGWTPDGRVRGVYEVVSTSSTDLTVTGQCNVDGNADMAAFTATKSINTRQNTAKDIY